MKKLSKILIFAIVLTTFTLPALPINALYTAQATPIRFRWGVMTQAGNWDIPVADGYMIIYTQYGYATREALFWSDKTYMGGTLGPASWEEWHPLLATSWDVTYWPEEQNSLGFFNRGGVSAIEFTLREDVKFHDGSDWNATVAKWNIDRVWVILGNLTGNGDITYYDGEYQVAADEELYFTPSWNLTAFGYGPGIMPSYNGMTATNEALRGTYPLIRNVTITDDQQTGGKIKVYFNSWNTYVTGWMPNLFISKQAYEPYWDRGIYGYDNSIQDPRNPTLVDHLVGTGPYIYQGHSDTAGGGTLIKNYNYWNRTELEAADWFDADYIDIITWAVGDEAARNTAMLAHAFDAGYDLMQWPLDYNEMVANPQITYQENRPSEYITTISLNCIEETWWNWSGMWGFYSPALVNSWYPTTYNPPNGNTPSSLPKAGRKAVCFAFDYDQYINQVEEGRALRPDTLLGTGNIFNVPGGTATLPDTDLAVARDALLNDAFFGPLCAAQGLEANSTDIEWQNVADGVAGKTPLWLLDFYWDTAFADLKNTLQTSISYIGFALKDPVGTTNFIPTYIWAELGTYWLTGFPMFSAHAWPLDYNYPRTISEGWIEANFADPNHLRWDSTYPDFYDPNWAMAWDGSWDTFPAWNFDFAYDGEMQANIDRMWMSNATSKAEYIDRICDIVQDEKYSRIVVSQAKQGLVYWNNWRVWDRIEAISYHHLDYLGAPVYPEIPGYEVGLITAISVVAIIGIIYMVKRKRRVV